MLDHPNIISYYDSFEEDGIVMIEMEYADGGFVYHSVNCLFISDYSTSSFKVFIIINYAINIYTMKAYLLILQSELFLG